VPDLATVAKIVEAASSSNIGILVDTLHFDRSGSSLSQLESIPPEWLPMAHVCDAPSEKPTTVEGLLHTARAERLPPGEGGIDIAAVLTRMPHHTQLALEVPMQRLTGLEGPEAVAVAFTTRRCGILPRCRKRRAPRPGDRGRSIAAE
jgi:hypothetical protein